LIVVSATLTYSLSYPGLLLRSVLDHGKFCWYHALEDKIESEEGGRSTIFDVIHSGSPRVVAQVRFTMSCMLCDDDIIIKALTCVLCLPVKTLNRMLEAHGKTKFPCHLFRKLATRDAGPLPERPIPGHCFSIPRLHLTPSRQLLVGFEVEMSNRVVRRFVEEEHFCPESFLRVQICDEDGQKLFYDDLSDSVVSRIMTTILPGVVLNGRRYYFLAYSSSQLKDSSLWMVCPEGGWTVLRMRESLGNFSVCKTASKYAARIGQCFSTTVQGLVGGSVLTPSLGGEVLKPGLSVEATPPLLHIQDIVSIHNGRKMCHSDGNGLIRREAMTKLVERLPFGPGRPEDVSIIQIRCGGAKGTLTAWDFDELETALFSSSLAGFDFCLRPSMIKFEASYKSVEVCSVGTHVPYYLNRNVILLLCFHGILDETFLGMQREVLDDLDAFLVNQNKALQMLPQIGGPDSAQKSLLLDMMKSGISPAKDPFLYSCFHAIRSHHIFGLRKKARIFIEKGAVLMGGIDETGIVPEGCVFVQVRKSLLGDHAPTKADFKPIAGPVMVTKHPVMHPGDVRMLLAIDVPELRRHNNVILFSRKGSRPEADKMAGSDLDGDEFAVTWDPRLFMKANFDPHDYDCSNTVESSPEAFPSDNDERSIALMNHFINHAKSDNLGQISMMWQDYAASEGAGCDECIELAALHSVAVDFPKTGVPAEVRRGLVIPRTQPRAHWREKKGTQSYHCTSVIGKLYDEATGQIDTELLNAAEIAVAGREKDKYGQLISTTEGKWVGNYLKKIYDDFIPHQLGFLIDDEWLQRFANEQRFSYDREVVTMMNRYKISSEGELFTGCIRKFHKYHKKRQHEVSETVRRECRELRKEHRSNFFRQVLKVATSSLDEDRNKSQAVASASHHDTAGVAVDVQEESEVNQDEKESEDEDEDEEVDTERLELVEHIATDTSSAPEGSRDWMIRKTAHRLAAAYYMSTYSPDLRWRQKGSTGSSLALFSFPWIVADVIACGLRDTP
jgi:RNA-dependent RNA polymerase